MAHGEEQVGELHSSLLDSLIAGKLIDIPERAGVETAGPVVDTCQSAFAEQFGCSLLAERVLEGVEILFELFFEHCGVVAGPNGARNHRGVANLLGSLEQLHGGAVHCHLNPTIIFRLRAACESHHGHGCNNQVFDFHLSKSLLVFRSTKNRQSSVGCFAPHCLFGIGFKKLVQTLLPYSSTSDESR